MARIMNWRLDLMLSHPRLFLVMADEPEYSFGYPRCEAGWRDILERLCRRIDGALRDGETFEFVRINQKLGILRVDWDCEASDDTEGKIGHAVDLAVARSACTCVICGADGRLYNNTGRFGTRCGEHAAGYPVPPKPGFENERLLRRWHGPADVYHARYDRDRHADRGVGAVARVGGLAIARFRYHACGAEGTFDYDGRRDCVQCGSLGVQLAIVEELPDDHPLIEERTD